MEPRHIEDVVGVIKEAPVLKQRVKAVGSKHSSNDIADTDGFQLSLVTNFKDI
jgi:hypothetical protein